MAIIRTTPKEADSGKVARDFQSKERPKTEELRCGISVPDFKNVRELELSMAQKAGYRRKVRFTQNAKNPEGVVSNIRELFDEARKALKENNLQKLGGYVRELAYTKKCGLMSGAAEEELIELTIAEIHGKLADGHDLCGLSFSELESHIKNDERLKAVVQHLLLMALENTAEKSKNSKQWRESDRDDFDNVLGMAGKVIERYKPNNWDEVVANVRQEVYSKLLKKEKARLMEKAKKQPHLPFQTFLEEFGSESAFFSDFRTLDKKLGMTKPLGIKEYEDIVRREVAEPAFEFYIKEVEEHLHVFDTGDDGKSSCSVDIGLRLIFAVNAFERVNMAFAYIDEPAIPKCKRILDDIISRLTPHLAKEMHKRIEDPQVSGRTITKLRNLAEKWVDLTNDTEIQEHLETLIRKIEGKLKDLRTEHNETKDPKILVELIQNLSSISPSSTKTEPNGPFVIRNTSPGLVTCPGCNEYVGKGQYTIKNPRISDPITLTELDLHALEKDGYSKEADSTKIRQIERVLGL